MSDGAQATPTIEPGEVHFTVEGHVATILIDRPRKLNAMTVAMDHQMNEICYEINQRDEVRAVVLRGAGERAFCAGSDINDLAHYGTKWQQRNRIFSRSDYVWAMLTVRKPIVTAVRGYVYGGGLEMICASDIRVGSPSATFCAAEIRNGWHGGSGSTQLLTRVVGPGMASLMLLTGDPIGTEDALRCGLLQKLVPDDELETTAYAIAERIAGLGPIAVESTKNMIRVAQSSALSVGMAYENDMFAYCMLTRDAQEGRDAFAEKRAPVFQGE
ncbi:MAG: enoyl-CoA hydratase/isomerase family protein [Thermomicrobiales bacterium]|nr:enoyl-CoA hydratase/isomerase family protein [Thermomicrobiales bacterium]